MSADSHKTDYVILAVLALASVAVCVYIASEQASGTSRGRQPPFRTSLSAHDNGAMGCYMLYEQLGVQVGRSYGPFSSRQLAEADVLVVVDPLHALHPAEHTAVGDWVRGGGLLICTTGVLTDEHGVDYGTTPYDLDEEDDAETSSTCRGPLARDVRTVAIGPATLDGQPDAWEDEGDLRPLLADERGVRIGERSLGSGRVIVLADSAFLANEHLGEGDNAVLAANLAAYSLAVSKGRRVVFDEYHFGIGRESPWWLMSEMLFQTSPGWALLCAATAAGAYLLLRGRRFGTRRDVKGRRRRSKLEFVNNVGGTFRAVRARGLTFEILLKWFTRRCAARAGLPATATPDRLAAALERIGPRSRGHYLAVLTQCAAASRRRLSARRFKTLLKTLAELESEIADGHSPSR